MSTHPDLKEDHGVQIESKHRVVIDGKASRWSDDWQSQWDAYWSAKSERIAAARAGTRTVRGGRNP